MSKKIEVILAEDIKKLGERLEIKKIKAGFYHNCSHIREKVWVCNKQNYRRLQRLKQKEQDAAILKEQRARKIYEQINGSTLSFSLNKDQNDRIVGSIRAEDILRELEKQNFQIEKKHLPDFSPLTELGDNSIKIKLAEGIVAQIKVVITAV